MNFKNLNEKICIYKRRNRVLTVYKKFKKGDQTGHTWSAKGYHMRKVLVNKIDLRTMGTGVSKDGFI